MSTNVDALLHELESSEHVEDALRTGHALASLGVAYLRIDEEQAAAYFARALPILSPTLDALARADLLCGYAQACLFGREIESAAMAAQAIEIYPFGDKLACPGLQVALA